MSFQPSEDQPPPFEPFIPPKPLRHFAHPWLRFICIVDRICDRGTPARRVLIVSNHTVFLTTLDQDTKRTIPVHTILSLVTSSVGSSLDQILLHVDGDCDLLVNFCQDDRNDPTQNITAFVSILQSIREQYGGKRIPESRGTFLRQQAALRNMNKQGTNATSRLDRMVLQSIAHAPPKPINVEYEHFAAEVALMQEAITDARDEVGQLQRAKVNLEWENNILNAQLATYRRTNNVTKWVKMIGIGGGQTCDTDASTQRMVELRQQREALRQEVTRLRLAAREAQSKESENPYADVPSEILEKRNRLLQERDALVMQRKKNDAVHTLSMLIVTISFNRLHTLLHSYENICETELKEKSKVIQATKSDLKEMQRVLGDSRPLRSSTSLLSSSSKRSKSRSKTPLRDIDVV